MRFFQILSTLVLTGALTSCSVAESPVVTPTGPSEVSAIAELGAQIAGLPVKDRVEYFADVRSQGRTGTARKTAPVDARPAEPGETVVSRLEGDGIETVSAPAVAGDMVVRSNCGANQETEILVAAEKFSTRYGSAQSGSDKGGYRSYLPTGEDMAYVIVSEADGEFALEAPWGEMMVARPGDEIVQNLGDPSDIYRIYGPAFDCTYEVVEPARS